MSRSLTTIGSSGLVPLKNRLPTRQEAFLVFAGIASLIHIWALLVGFDQMPALLNKMDLWTTLSVLSYVLLVALFESLLISGILLVIVWMFPKDALGGKRAVLVSIFSILAFLWLIPSHYPVDTKQNLSRYLPFLTMQTATIVWAILFVLVCAGLAFLLRKKPDWMQRLAAILDRVTVLAGFYLLIDAIGIIVIIVMNLV